MRNPTNWRNDLVSQIKKEWAKPTQENSREYNRKLATLCNVEIGLYLLSQLAPNEPASALWVLLTGYNFPVPIAENWSEEQRQMLGNARHILSHIRSSYKWEQVLEKYRNLDERVRGYDIDEKNSQWQKRPVSICANRERVYAQTLRHPIPHRQNTVEWASAGSYKFVDEKNQVSSVKIPQELVFAPPERYSFAVKEKQPEISVSLDELIETAQWMDSQGGKRKTWKLDLDRVELELFENGILTRANRLTVKEMMHLIGMVSSGKSTLMDVLAVWAARNKLHVTLVVLDVVGALNRAKLFTELGISVAPILGASNRQRHTERLHRNVTAENTESPLNQEHTGFRWLSTACAIDGLRRDERETLQIGNLPCTMLSSSSDEEKKYYCPIYSKCQFHQAQRDLVDASIWIATPESLVYTRVPNQLAPSAPPSNKKAIKIRFSEMVYRHSDLVIVDEADLVQMRLDNTFSPNETLVSRGKKPWLNQLRQHVNEQIDDSGRDLLADNVVFEWNAALNNVNNATDKVYQLLLNESEINNWLKGFDEFTELTLLQQVAEQVSGTTSETRAENPVYQKLKSEFDKYIDNPLGENGDNPLAGLAIKVISHSSDTLVRQQIEEWIIQQIGTDDTITNKAEPKSAALKLEFALVVAVLLNRLNLLCSDWKQIEAPLKLENMDSNWFDRPPDDYFALIPPAPMGNVLALQYVRSLENPDAAGTLRFLRLMGVGRWFLLNFHKLFAADGIEGPHVLLLSGTSWAGTSPGCHVQIPVAGVLRSPDKEVEAIKKSSFKFLRQDDDNQEPIRVSGLSGDARTSALKKMLSQLTKRGKIPGGKENPSHLESTLDSLPENRQRLLLVVGSYDEARLAYEHLEILPNWRGKSRPLVSDDDELEDALGIQRGLVDKFSSKNAQILIAPLLSIERGHNILNDDKVAALGAAYFLIRPHPHPHDLSYAIQSINRWAIEHSKDLSWINPQNQSDNFTIAKVGEKFRKAAFIRWRELLSLEMRYSTLPDQEREAVTWNQLVAIWQVIGRLIRGGCRAQVFFCDAAFAPNTVKGEKDTPATSLLVGMEQILQPYFTTSPDDLKERELVKALYEPLYSAIRKLTDEL